MIPPNPPSARVVLTYGRFDGLNQRHLRLLQELAVMGSELIVGCATDAHADTLLRPCKSPFDQRRSSLECCRHVSRVIPLHSISQVRTDIVNYDVSTVVMHERFDGLAEEVQDIAQILWLVNGRFPKTTALPFQSQVLALTG